MNESGGMMQNGIILDSEFEVSQEDVMILRNNWKLVSTTQFLCLFKNVLKLKESVTPYDLEQSLLRPQHDPLCGEILSKLLSQKKSPNMDYDAWNFLLAKKFNMMYKTYLKLFKQISVSL